MKKNPTLKLACIVLLAIAGECFGTITVLEAWREVGVVGYAGGYGYESVESLSGGGVFSGNVSGSADARDPVVAWPGEYSGHSEGYAGQVSEIGEGGLVVSGGGGIESWTGFGRQENAYVQAWNEIAFSFEVLEPQWYELSLEWDLFTDLPNFGGPVASLSFGTLSGTVLAGRVRNASGYLEQSWSGLLVPDVYELSFFSQFSGASDPLGDQGNGRYEVSLAVTSVPEGGDTLWLLGIGIAGVVAARHFRVRAVGERFRRISCLWVAGVAISCLSVQAQERNPYDQDVQPRLLEPGKYAVKREYVVDQAALAAIVEQNAREAKIRELEYRIQALEAPLK